MAGADGGEGREGREKEGRGGGKKEGGRKRMVREVPRRGFKLSHPSTNPSTCTKLLQF